MSHCSALLASALLLGCTATHQQARTDVPTVPVGAATALELAAAAAPAAAPAAVPGPSLAPLAAVDIPAPAGERLPVDDPLAGPSPLQAQAQALRRSRFTVKGGYYSSDEDALDDGWIGALSCMQALSPFAAVEFEIGYLEADGRSGAFDTEVQAFPLMVNGRLNVPIWVLDVYGGAGIGTMHYDADAKSGVISVSNDGYILAGNVFAGATINLADTVAVGLEAKYYVTDDFSSLDLDLDAVAVMLTLGFRM
jgi:opacity protein-like surface antigen